MQGAFCDKFQHSVPCLHPNVHKVQLVLQACYSGTCRNYRRPHCIGPQGPSSLNGGQIEAIFNDENEMEVQNDDATGNPIDIADENDIADEAVDEVRSRGSFDGRSI